MIAFVHIKELGDDSDGADIDSSVAAFDVDVASITSL